MSTGNIPIANSWSETRVADLKRLWLEGKSASQISRQLGGVTRNAVIGKVHRMGLAGRDRPKAPRELARTYHRQLAVGEPSSIARPRPVRSPAAPTPSCHPAPELTVTATLLSLAGEGCRWPIGDPRETTFGYCGRCRGRHVSYCDHHAGLAMPKRSPRGASPGLVRLPA
jgi:GcrA cell cycle regulator